MFSGHHEANCSALPSLPRGTDTSETIILPGFGHSAANAVSIASLNLRLWGTIEEHEQLSVAVKSNLWASESMPHKVLSVCLEHCVVGITVVSVLLLNKLRILGVVEQKPAPERAGLDPRL